MLWDITVNLVGFMIVAPSLHMFHRLTDEFGPRNCALDV